MQALTFLMPKEVVGFSSLLGNMLSLANKKSVYVLGARMFIEVKANFSRFTQYPLK